MPPPRLNPARQLPIPLPSLGSAPGMWEQPRTASPLPSSSQSSPQDLAKGDKHYDNEAPTWGIEAEEEEGEVAVRAHGSLGVWDKLQPVARGAGHLPGPASRCPFAPVVAVPARPGHGSSAPGSARRPSQPLTTRSSAGFGCHPTLLHRAARSGTGKISWEVIFGRILVHLQTSAASPGISIKRY